jgi:hypothetical protein
MGDPCSLVIRNTGITANFFRASASGIALSGRVGASSGKHAAAPKANERAALKTLFMKIPLLIDNRRHKASPSLAELDGIRHDHQ